MTVKEYLLYLGVMAGVTYLLRALPFTLLKRQIQSEFLQSFLAYIPYTVLAAMTVPAIFFATESRISGICAFVAAVVVSLCGKGLVSVACAASAAVLLAEGFMRFFG